jgi:hypothetical protein
MNARATALWAPRVWAPFWLVLLATGCRDRLPQPLLVLAAPQWDAPANEGSWRAAEQPEDEVVDPASELAAQIRRVRDSQEPLTAEEIQTFASSPDLRLRRDLAHSLAYSRSPEALAALDTLDGLTSDPVAAVRFHAFTALGAAGADGVRRLVARTSDAGEEDLLGIIAAMQNNREPIVTDTLIPLLTHPSDAVAVAAVRGLLGRPFPLAPLVAALADSRVPVACEASLVLAFSEHPTELLPAAPVASAGPQALGCFAALETRHGNDDLVACAEAATFDVADVTQQIFCVQALLASDSEAATRVIVDWHNRRSVGEAGGELLRYSHYARSAAAPE